MIITAARRAVSSFFTIALLGAAFVIFVPAAQAQKGGTPLPKNQAEFEKQVGITAAQKAKMTAIGKKYEPKAKVLQTKMQALQKQMMALQQQMQTLGTQANKEVEGVLTPAQQTKVKAIQAAMAQQQQGMMGGAGGGKMR